MKIITTAKAYTKFESTPMQVDVQLAKPAAFYHMPELDGLLARVVVDEATRGRGLPDSAEPYFIPLPLEKLWTCPTTFAPLWNATHQTHPCLLYTSPSPRDRQKSRMPSSA